MLEIGKSFLADAQKMSCCKIDKIIKEPLGGAHYDRAATFDAVKAEILKTFKTLDKLSPQDLIDQRRDKFEQMGVFND